jgi:Histidine kinase-, DNA gyrase B-, and HSP90-like ATPase
MDITTLKHATEPFFTTKPPGEGIGLGLSMAKGFAEQSGGVLTISSTIGQGTRVDILLPEAEGIDPFRRRLEPEAEPNNLHILLVDDDAPCAWRSGRRFGAAWLYRLARWGCQRG